MSKVLGGRWQEKPPGWAVGHCPSATFHCLSLRFLDRPLPFSLPFRDFPLPFPPPFLDRPLPFFTAFPRPFAAFHCVSLTARCLFSLRFLDLPLLFHRLPLTARCLFSLPQVEALSREKLTSLQAAYVQSGLEASAATGKSAQQVRHCLP